MDRRHFLGGATALVGAALSRRAHAAKGRVRLAYVEWSDTIVATTIMATVLRQAGYDVTSTPVSGAAMWQAVASSDADAMLAGWLPGTHAAYYARLKDRVDLIGPNVTGARLGWAVPDYVPLASIAELKQQGALFGNRVIGIDPGAGLMRASEKAIKDYDLSTFQLLEGTDATMVAALKDAVSRKQPIIVTTWTPHWMWAAFQIKYLADPKTSLGGEETVNTVARKGLRQDMPEVHAILSRFKLTLADEQALMLKNQAAGVDPDKTAEAWVRENPDLVKSWVA